MLGIYAGAAADRAVELAEVCAAEVLDLAERGPSEAEMSRARAVLNASLWMADEGPASRAGRHAAQTLIFGEPVSSDLMAERIMAQTPDDLKQVGRELVGAGLASTAVLGPKAAGPAGRGFTLGLWGTKGHSAS